MADVVLNLIYNDNGAGKNVDNLVHSLQQIESKHYRVNISTPDVQASVNSLKRMTDEINRIKNLSNIRLSFTTEQASISSLDSIIKVVESKIEAARIRAQQLAIELEARLNLGGVFEGEPDESGVGTHIQSLQTQINNAQEQVVLLVEELDILNEHRVDADITSGLTEQIEETNRAEKDLIETHEQVIDSSKDVSNANAEIALGYKQTWRGVQQTVSGVLSTLQNAYNTWKSVVEAPLNLTGVSSLVSMLESMEGGLLLNQISSNITTGFSEGVERYDILMSFPAVMEHIGYSADQATSAMDRLYQSVLGLPTSFGDIVQNTQFFTLVLDDLEKATDLAIAANNAFVASGADSQQISSGMRQLQYILEGTKLRSTQWYSLIRSMPLALREVGDALGYPDFAAFTEDLMSGSIASEELIDTLIDVGLHSENLGNIIGVMKSRITAALENVTNAGRRLGETLVESLDNVLTREGGKGIAENIKGVSSIIDHIAQVAANWIDEHGSEIQALIDKFFDIDWTSVVPEFLQGLVNIANKALDNIGKWIQDVGGIIEKVGTLFNDIENSQTLKVISGIVSGLGSFAQIFTGISNVILGSALIKGGSAAGGSLAGAFAKWFGAAGTTAAGTTAAGTTAAGTTAAGTTAAGTTAAGTTAAGGIGFVGSGIIISSIVSAISEQNEKNKIRTENSSTNTELMVGNSRLQDIVRRLNEAYEYLKGGESKAVPNEVRTGVANYWNTFYNEQYRKAFSELISEYPNIRYFTSTVESKDTKPITYYRVDFDEDELTRMEEERAKKFEERISGRYEEAILRAEAESLWESIPNSLYESWDNVWMGYKSRLNEVEKISDRVKNSLKELQESTDKWYNSTIDEMEKIYGGKMGKDGKFFSEQVKEAFGGLYRNTTRDYLGVQEDASELVVDVNNQMIDAINNLPEGERAKYLETWANYLGTLDLSDADVIARLQTMNKEGGEKILETWLVPKQKLDEVMNNNTEMIKQMRMSALTSASEDLDDAEQKILDEASNDSVFNTIGVQLVEWAKKMSRDYLPIIEENLGDFSNDVVKAIQDMIDRINNRSFYINPKITINEQPGWVSPEGYHANGGWISRGTDTVPAMLTPGEYVQRRAAVEHFGRMFMDRINNLDLNGALRALHISVPYATGGIVKNDSRSYRDNHAVVNQVFNSANASTGFRRASRYVRALG